MKKSVKRIFLESRELQIMNNSTSETSIRRNFLRRYFLGESGKHMFLRLLFILSIILIVWLCMMLFLIIQVQYRKRKQVQQVSYENPANNCKHTARFHSSTASISSNKFHSIHRILPQMKPKCPIWFKKKKNAVRYGDNNSEDLRKPMSKRTIFLNKASAEYHSDHELQCIETCSNLHTVTSPFDFKPNKFDSFSLPNRISIPACLPRMTPIRAASIHTFRSVPFT